MLLCGGHLLVQSRDSEYRLWLDVTTTGGVLQGGKVAWTLHLLRAGALILKLVIRSVLLAKKRLMWRIAYLALVLLAHRIVYQRVLSLERTPPLAGWILVQARAYLAL